MTEKKYKFDYKGVTASTTPEQLQTLAKRGSGCGCKDCLPCCAYHFVTSNALQQELGVEEK
jgi:hypothetical protein